MKSFLMVVLTLFSTLVCKAQGVKKSQIAKAPGNSIIGRSYNDEKEIKEFKGYKNMGGGLLDYNSAISQKVEYALSQMYKPGKLILILSKTNEDTTKGKWILLDTVSVKQNIYKDQYSLVMEGCSVNKKRDNLIFAILPYDQNKKILKNPLRVFRVDRTNDKIIELRNRKGVFCINNAYGAVD